MAATTSGSPAHWTKCELHYDFATATRIVRKVCVKHPMPRLRNHRPSWGHVLISDRLVSPHVRVRVWFPRTYQPRPPEGYRTTLSVSAYAPGCGASGAMASGQYPFVGAAAGTFPFGTHISVPGFGTVTVLDRGVPGGYLDLFMNSCGAAIVWGRRLLTVTVY